MFDPIVNAITWDAVISGGIAVFASWAGALVMAKGARIIISALRDDSGGFGGNGRL